MRYRCYLEVFIDVEAENDKDAESKALKKLCSEGLPEEGEDLRAFVVWHEEEDME